MVAVVTVTPDPARPLDVILDVTDLDYTPVILQYRQQLPTPAQIWPVDLTLGTALTVTLVGDLSDTYRLIALIYQVADFPDQAPTVTYQPAVPSGYVGWPSDSDLADRLGLTAGDDADRVTNANQAAIADAMAVCELDPVAGCEDHGQLEAVLLLGQWWYQNRNRPEGLDSLNPVASPYYRRVAIGILQRGRIPVA